jgi:hypothetical protein
MRLPSRSAQIKPTSRYCSVAFVMVASVLGGIILLDEERHDKEASSERLILFHRDEFLFIPMGRSSALARSLVTRHDT